MPGPQHHPYQLTAPVSMTVQPGGAGTFQVINTGSKPVTVHESLGRYSASAVRYPAASHATLTTFDHPWLSVWPEAFTLRPGEAETVHIASHVPAGATGNHWLSVLWAIEPAHPAAGLNVAGGIATSVEIPLPGVAVPITGRGVAGAPLAPVPQATIGALELGAALSAAVLLVALAIVLGLAIRRRLARRPA